MAYGANTKLAKCLKQEGIKGSESKLYRLVTNSIRACVAAKGAALEAETVEEYLEEHTLGGLELPVEYKTLVGRMFTPPPVPEPIAEKDRNAWSVFGETYE